MGEVGLRVLRGDVLQYRFVFEQAGAPAFQTMQARDFGGGVAAHVGERGADRFRGEAAHELADVLELAAPGFEFADALVFEQGGEQIFVQAHALQLIAGEARQFFAERLQIVHRLLALGLGGAGAVRWRRVLAFVEVHEQD